MLLAFILPAACLDLALDADLEGPRVVASSLAAPRTLEVPVRETLVVGFSEPLDATRLRVALLAWEERASCELTPICPVGSCERGRCQEDPVTPAALDRLADGEPIEGAIALDLQLVDEDAALQLTPVRPLVPHARHSLLVAARDRRGAPLVDDTGVAAIWRRDFVTAGPGSSGPEPLLVSPPPLADGVPTDLARVDTRFVRPVAPTPDARLVLRGDDGLAIELGDPRPCPGWLPDLCLSWRPARALTPGVVYHLGGGDLRDRVGRPAIEPAERQEFRAGPGPDPAPPELRGLRFTAVGRCVRAEFVALEPLRVRLSAGAEARERVAPAGPLALALRRDGAPGERVRARLTAADLAGREAAAEAEHVLGDTFHPAAPPLALGELLANPRGPEPAQEFVELVDLREVGGPLEVRGLRLVDGPPDALDLGGGDPLPTFISLPGQRHLAVPASYDPRQGDDPGPPPSASLLRVDASLADGGLKNAPGEALALVWETGPSGYVLIDIYGGWADPGDLPGQSLVRDPAACDEPDAWRPHPGGAASPGQPP